jgi:hypothetical protein
MPDLCWSSGGFEPGRAGVHDRRRREGQAGGQGARQTDEQTQAFLNTRAMDGPQASVAGMVHWERWLRLGWVRCDGWER